MIKNKGCWCPKCAHKLIGDKKRGTLEPFIKAAKERGGKCLSTGFTNNHANLEWECAEGHRWKATANNVRRGSWCNICVRKRMGENQRDKIETFQEIAAKKGGKCLSTNYVNNRMNLEFECAKGHIWKIAPGSVKNMGLWCKICKAEEKKKL